MSELTDVEHAELVAAVQALENAVATDSDSDGFTRLEDAGWDLVELTVAGAQLHPERSTFWAVLGAALILGDAAELIGSTIPGMSAGEVYHETEWAVANVRSGDAAAAYLRIIILAAAVEQIARDYPSSNSIDTVIAAHSAIEHLSLAPDQFNTTLTLLPTSPQL